MSQKHTLVVLDFDGFLVDSYELIRTTFAELGLDIGDEERFKRRRKFLKYLGGGRELMRNLVRASIPKKPRLRRLLTDAYLGTGRVYPVFSAFLNRLIADPGVHVGIVSRNFTVEPGPTMRVVLRNSGIDEDGLDFVIPIPIGAHKDDILRAMQSRRYRCCLLGADEIGDYRAAVKAGYQPVIGSYGFDVRERLIEKGGVPAELIAATPGQAMQSLQRHCALALVTRKAH